MNWFSLFHTIITAGATSLGLVVSSVVPSSHHTDIIRHPYVTPTSTPTVVERMLTIDKTVETMGKHVTVHLQMPEDGGSINGVITGDCQGTIDGNYTGKPQDTFNGKGDVTCTIGFLSLPATATFQGTVHEETKTALINYSISSGSNFSKSGSVNLSYSYN